MVLSETAPSVARQPERLAALDTLYRTHEAAVFTLARRMLGNDADADDVTQESFLQADRKRHEFRGDGSDAGWLKRICVTQVLMRLRRQKARELDEAPLEPVTPGSAERRDLTWALDQLPGITRSVVWLHDVEGYTHEEIAGIFERTASFSRSQLSRAHARLRQLLEAEP